MSKILRINTNKMLNEYYFTHNNIAIVVNELETVETLRDSSATPYFLPIYNITIYNIYIYIYIFIYIYLYVSTVSTFFV